MFQVLSNQHYPHRSNQKLRAWANAVFQNHGDCGKAVPSFPSPSPIIHFCFCSCPNILDELTRKCLLRRLHFFFCFTLVSFFKKKILITLSIVKQRNVVLFCIKQSSRLTGISVWLYQAFHGLTKCRAKIVAQVY